MGVASVQKPTPFAEPQGVPPKLHFCREAMRLSRRKRAAAPA
jgi:hypothetical protein